MKTIVDEMLAALTACLARGQMPNRCRLSTEAFERFDRWVQTIDQDPFVGPVSSGLNVKVFGADIFHDPSVPSGVVYDRTEAA